MTAPTVPHPGHLHPGYTTAARVVRVAENSEVLIKQYLDLGAQSLIVPMVDSAEDARRRMEAGADLVQGYTAFLYEGPFYAARIVRGLRRGSRRPGRRARRG